MVKPRFQKKVQTPRGGHNDPSQLPRLQKFAQNGSTGAALFAQRKAVDRRPSGFSTRNFHCVAPRSAGSCSGRTRLWRDDRAGQLNPLIAHTPVYERTLVRSLDNGSFCMKMSERSLGRLTLKATIERRCWPKNAKQWSAGSCELRTQ
jgi:hypothetical protein